MQNINYYKPERVQIAPPYFYYIPAKLHLKIWEWVWKKLIKHGLINEIKNPAAMATRFNPIEFDTRDLIDMCYQLLGQYERTGKRAKRIIMGRNSQHQLMRQVCSDPYTLSLGIRGMPDRLMGLELEFNPFIDGIVISGD